MPSGVPRLKTAGTMKPNAQIISIDALIRRRRESKCCSPCHIPPVMSARPKLTSRLARMAPVSEAFTTPARPWARATPPMISSGRLFSVELSSPPIVGPSFDASRSVAVPMMPTSGRIATSDAQNTTVGWASDHSRPMANGTATSSHSRFISRSFRTTKGFRPADRRACPPGLPGHSGKWRPRAYILY